MSDLKRKRAAVRILIVDDDPEHLFMLKTVLGDWGYAANTAASGEEAARRCQEELFALILMDVKMRGQDGIETLEQIRKSGLNAASPVVIMTAYSKVEDAVRAMKGGAYDYLLKPLDLDLLRLTLERALEHHELKAEKAAGLFWGGDFFRALLGESGAFRKVLDIISLVAPSEATVLIMGESGVGKELVARAIVEKSPRSAGPFIAINCAALSESLLEAELFGHEKGAFTGAERRREGRLKAAHGGTVFLDEIGETSQALQAKLLRAIQEGEVQAIGSDETEKIDVRFIAATNRDLVAEVAAGRFREDLYWRLNVVAIEVPPLRNRADDLPILTQHFLRLFADKNHKEVKGVSPGALKTICEYNWPGNIRELQNAIERGVILMRGEYLCEEDLPPLGRTLKPKETLPEMPSSLDDLEKMAVAKAISESGGNKSQAARILGVTRKTLAAKLKKYSG